MTKKRMVTVFTLLGLLVLTTFIVARPAGVSAVEPGVYVVEGNPSCADLNGFTYDWAAGITSDFGFKIDGVPTQDMIYYFTSTYGELTGGAPSDPNSYVTFPYVMDPEFDWEASLSIDAVIVKGGAGGAANAYVYVPEAYEGGPLTTPAGQSISHVEFCYDYELTASKTANAEYTRTYTWDITKGPDGTYKGFIGDAAFNHGYTVSVDQTVTDSGFKVTGDITINNPTPFGVGFSVSDLVDGTAAMVTCPGDDYTLNPGETKVCSYVAELGDTRPEDGTNTATITSLNPYVDGTTAEQAYAFGEPTTVEGESTINVTDSFYSPLGSASGDKTFDTYYKSFQCPADQGMYTNGVYIMPEFKNTATIDETGQSDDAYANLTCYAPVLDKDAFASWEKKYDWTITKGPDETYKGFIGDPVFDHGYVVTVDQTVTDQNFKVYGSIYVSNPSGSPGNMTVSLADELAAGVFATVDCDGAGATSVTVAPGNTGTCSYSGYLAAKTDGTNKATGSFNGVTGFEATEPYAFGAPTIVGYPTINVTDDDYGSLGSASDDKTFYYSKAFQCSGDKADYVDGVWTMDQFVNTASIDEIPTEYDTAKVDLTCYAPVPSKDASTFYTRQYDWTITKDYDGEYWKFIGDAADTHNYLVSVDQTISEYDFAVAGTITVKNYNPKASMAVSLEDYVDSKMATLDCGGSLVVPAATDSGPGEATCGYSADLGDTLPSDGTNTATVTLNEIDFDATADYFFGDPTTVIGDKDINVSDTNGGSWMASSDASWAYSKDFVCSSNPADYTDGFYSFTHENTATIDETDQSDDAKVTVNCYAPVPSKTAAGAYDERHEWTVDKTVTPLEQGGYPGDVLGWTWKVYVYEDVYEENFAVSGVITVKNYNPKAAMTVSLKDYVDSTMATLDCGGTLVVPAATDSGPGEATCGYSVSLPAIADDADAPTLNTATATLNNIGFDATASIAYTAKRIRGNATLTDDEIGLSESLTGHTQAGTYTFGPYTGSDSHICSSDRADYFTDGVYTQMTDTIVNWAYVDSDGEEQDKDDATTTWTCDASFVDLYKTTNGQPADPTKDISFALYSGTTQLEVVSTLGNGADLQFQTALVPGEGYTICEYPVPAGYTFEITVNGGGVPTYAGPPSESNPTGEIQCFDFTAGSAGTTLTYNVNNRYPGGAPRTPGYWKNWNRCSGGNQAATADRLNDGLGPWEGAGVFLLDDLLPQTIGDFTIDTCEDGVAILSTYSLGGKNMNNDAAYTLATALLAARLNQDAGACVPPSWDPPLEYVYNGETQTFTYFEEVLTAADGVLSEVGFDGTDSYLGPKNKKDKDLAAYALWLYEIIDDYNNSELCTGDPSH